MTGDLKDPYKTPLDFENWKRDQPDNWENMESNVVMTLDTTCYSCKAGTSRWLNDWDGSMSSDDGKWNDVAESSLHHTMCEYSNENVKEIGFTK